MQGSGFEVGSAGPEKEARAFQKAAKIAVIVPAYNQARYLAEALGSVLEQSRRDFEMIVVDDGSTDETPAILAAIEDPRVRVLRQANAGLSAARNAGLLRSTAALVTFLDADDCFLPGRLEAMSRFLEERPDIGLVAGRVRYIDDAGKAVERPEAAPSPLALPELLLQNPICVSAVLLRRTWLDRVGLFDETLRACEDMDLWLRLSAAGCRMAWMERPVVAYRIHQGQMTSQPERMRKAIFTVLEKFFGRPDLPAHLGRYRTRAYASAFVHAAAFAYLSGDAVSGSRDLGEALRLDHTLQDDRYKRLVRMLVGWANDPRALDPALFLRRVIGRLPAGHRALGVQLRRALSDLLLSPLFRGGRQTWRARKKDLFEALAYKPGWLLNRGVLRMVADAWLPFR